MIDWIKKYFENRIQLIRLELINILAKLAPKLISSFLIILLSLLVLFMFSMALSFQIGRYYDNMAIGFAAVGCMYLLVLIVYLLFVKKSVDVVIKDKVVRTVLDVESEILGDK